MSVELKKRLFSVYDYHRMAEAGILGEHDRVELIEGEIVAMSPIGPPHNAAVNRATRALVNAVGDRAIVQIQGSVRLNNYNEAQPAIREFKRQESIAPQLLPECQIPIDTLLV